jgi:glycosyltransferase involved in cell wall biosynthesis
MIIIVDDGSPTWPGERVVSGWVGDGVPYVIQRYFANRRNLSRSWNTGFDIARGFGCGYVVFGNSDLVFPRGWWEPLQAAIDEGTDFVGPVTNAPGHVRAQDVTRYLPSYELSDDPDDIEATQRELLAADHSPIETSKLNGFCFAGRTDRFAQIDKRPFSEQIPLLGNEDDFVRRAIDERSMSANIIPKSFVFHYRSVTLGLDPVRPSQGAVRIPGCIPCANRGSHALPQALLY